jgi:NADH:ubiquinone oxidoreductase subunit 5 (subunit L)/multisubunit Na+/H+ antiporter MnhA subunit
VFLGEPRSPDASNAHEAGAAMRWPMIVLAALCVLIGLTAPMWPILLQPAVATIVPEYLKDAAATSAGQAIAPLMGVMFGSYVLLALITLFVLVRRRLLIGRRVEQTVTWDCGYAAPTPRMQYTASSFALWFVEAFRWILRTERRRSLPQGYFPDAAFMTTETPDGFRELVFRPVFAQIRWALAALRWIQHGRLQLYILYIAVTLVALLIWYASCL